MHTSGLWCLQVNVLQMHGTGTALGDPIEVNAALTALLAKGPAGELPLSLSAHKSSAGHAESAAGLVGLACAMTALEAASVPALVHLRWASSIERQTLVGYKSSL